LLITEQLVRQLENNCDGRRPTRKPPVYRNFLFIAVI